MRTPTSFQVNDVVALAADIPGQALSKGTVGAVIHRFDVPTRAYEFEFVAHDGQTALQVTLLPDQIVAYKAGMDLKLLDVAPPTMLRREA